MLLVGYLGVRREGGGHGGWVGGWGWGGGTVVTGLSPELSIDKFCSPIFILPTLCTVTALCRFHGI